MGAGSSVADSVETPISGCWVCRQPGTENCPLVRNCACTGPLGGFVQVKCVIAERDHNPEAWFVCPICKEDYRQRRAEHSASPGCSRPREWLGFKQVTDLKTSSAAALQRTKTRMDMSEGRVLKDGRVAGGYPNTKNQGDAIVAFTNSASSAS